MNRTKMGENGIVSILVTMIMILVIGLIVIGFAQVAQRNQREAQDRQLSTQAYYAAETGVNDAVAYLKANPGTAVNTADCATSIATLGNKNKLTADGGVAYTCLSINNTPTTLTKAPMALSNTIIWPVVDRFGDRITSMRFEWGLSSATPTGNPATWCNDNLPANGLPSFKNWNCNYGVLRVDILNSDNVNLAGTSAANSDSLNSFVHTMYFVPNISAANANDVTTGIVGGFNNKGIVAPIRPPASGSTMSTTIEFTGTATTRNNYVRLTMLYGDAAVVKLSAKTFFGPSGLVGAQAVIDSTGKAQDVLRRLQVSVPLTGQSDLPQFALQSTNDICKQFTASSVGYVNDGTCP